MRVGDIFYKYENQFVLWNYIQKKNIQVGEFLNIWIREGQVDML